MTSICFSEIMLRTSGLSVSRHWITANTSVERGKRRRGGEKRKEGGKEEGGRGRGEREEERGKVVSNTISDRFLLSHRV